jgi:hypothetical protein
VLKLNVDALNEHSGLVGDGALESVTPLIMSVSEASDFDKVFEDGVWVPPYSGAAVTAVRHSAAQRAYRKLGFVASADPGDADLFPSSVLAESADDEEGPWTSQLSLTTTVVNPSVGVAIDPSLFTADAGELAVLTTGVSTYDDAVEFDAAQDIAAAGFRVGAERTALEKIPRTWKVSSRAAPSSESEWLAAACGRDDRHCTGRGPRVQDWRTGRVRGRLQREHGS